MSLFNQLKHMNQCCIEGNLESLKTYFNNDDYLNIPNINQFKNSLITSTVRHEQFETLHFLLNYFNKKETEDKSMAMACRAIADMGNVKALEYLFEQFPNDRTLHSSITDGWISIPAIQNGDWDMIKYIFESETIKKHVNIIRLYDDSFQDIYYSKNPKILNYFVCDLNMPITRLIQLYINKDPELELLFKWRDLNKSLNLELPTEENKTLNKKHKV